MKKNKFQIKKEETYRQLIEKGYDVLISKGFSKTNIDDIAKAAGYTRGAFYFHFESKEDFFLHILKHHNERRGDWNKFPYQFDSETTSLEEVLRSSVSTLWGNVYDGSMSGWLLVGIDFYENTRHDPSIKPKLQELNLSWENDVVKFVEGLQSQGFVSSSIDPNEAANQFIMATFGFMINYYIYDKKDINILIDFYLKILS